MKKIILKLNTNTLILLLYFRYYKEALLPEIVKPMAGSGKSVKASRIREADYVKKAIEAKKESTEKKESKKKPPKQPQNPPKTSSEGSSERKK